MIGSLLIYILTYLTIKTGIIDENLIMFNLEMLFLFVMIIQGMAVTFYFGYIKKIPKPVLLILSGIFILTWLGQTVLFLLGLIDVMFNIRKRISQTKL